MAFFDKAACVHCVISHHEHEDEEKKKCDPERERGKITLMPDAGKGWVSYKSCKIGCNWI